MDDKRLPGLSRRFPYYSFFMRRSDYFLEVWITWRPKLRVSQFCGAWQSFLHPRARLTGQVLPGNRARMFSRCAPLSRASLRESRPWAIVLSRWTVNYFYLHSAVYFTRPRAVPEPTFPGTAFTWTYGVGRHLNKMQICGII